MSAVAELWGNITDYITDTDRWLEWLLVGLRILVIFTVGKLAIRLLNRLTKHLAEEKDKLRINPRRSATMVRLVGNIIKYVIHFMMILMILGELGIPLAPVLAGAGVLGLAVGFGAQSLVKDVITGFFIIFEDQFAVGDEVKIGVFQGTVQEIGLRVTRIRGWTGEEHIIPNGSITQVTNFSLHSALMVMDIAIGTQVDVDQAIRVIRETAEDVCASHENAVKPPAVLGMQALMPSEIVIRVVCECKPNTQQALARVLNAEIKRGMDAQGLQVTRLSSLSL